MDEQETMLPAMLLASLQRLTPAARRQLINGRGTSGSVPDWQDEDAFYSWLAGLYAREGTGHCDAILTREGGNSARRTFQASARDWAATELYRAGATQRQDRTSPLSVLAGIAREREISIVVDALSWAETVLTPRPGDGAGGQDDKGPHEAEAENEADNFLDEVLETLEKLRNEPDPAVLVLVRQFKADLSGLLEARRAEFERASKLARLDALVAALPETVREMLGTIAVADWPSDRIGVLIERLEVARVAIERLGVARRHKMEAASGSREQRKLAAGVESDAEVDLDEAVAALRRAWGGETTEVPPGQLASLEAETNPEIERPADTLPAPSPDVWTDEVPPMPSAPDGQPSPDGGAATATSKLSLPLPEPPLALAEEDPEDVVPVVPSDPWDAWVGMALDAGFAGLGVHLARGRELAGADTLDSWPTDIIEAAIIGLGVAASGDRAMTRYGDQAPELERIARSLHPATDSGFGQALALIAGAARPSLVANYPGKIVLEALPIGGPLTELRRLIDFLREGSKLGLQAVADLARPAEQHVRDRQRKMATDNLRRWYGGAQSRTLPYQPATLLWSRDFIARNGLVGSVIETILAESRDAAAGARDLVGRLRDDAPDMLDRKFDAMLDRSRARTIHGIARERFLGRLNEARDLLEAWLRAAGGPRPKDDRLERPRAELHAALETAGAHLRQLRAGGGPWTARGAALLQRALDGLLATLRGEDAPPDPDLALDGEIALLPEFPLDGRTTLRIGVDDVGPLREAASRTLPDGIPTWPEAFKRAIETQAASVAYRTLSFLPADEELLRQVQDCVADARKVLGAKRQRLRAQLDDLQSASTGDTTTNELETALVELEGFDLDALPRMGEGEEGTVGDFPRLQGRVDFFTARLAEARALVAAQLDMRIVMLEAQGQSVEVCRTLLERGDLGTLAEELAQIELHGQGSAAVRPKELLEGIRFFARDVLVQLPEDHALQPASLRDAARRGERRGAFRFDLLPDSERAEASALLDAWTQLKRAASGAPGEVGPALVKVLGALGFTGAAVSKQANWRGGRQLSVRVDALRSAGDCVVPAFGSEAEGSYTVLVMPKSTLENSLTGLDELSGPVIAFAPEWLTPKARREFLRRARTRPAASYALLDDPAAAALAATAGRSLRSFFSIAVPFGAARPYADKAAATSVEMFFGRQGEYDRLVDPQGSCLVYGGRQLGKTALLRQIKLRMANNPNVAVIYLDIKRVGSSEVASSVWDEISRQMKPLGIPGPDVPSRPKVIDAIKAWLRHQPQRRLLVLLDEADAFLEAEIEADFKEIMAMKGLMEDTERRAKFVFAGLHNVQRFVRTPNSPMLHLGAPVNIGPLLGDDRDAARRMVFEPMAAVGVGFRDDTDAHHMLSLVGYYPSLLQTFGKSLLATVDKQLGQRGEATTLPFLLDRQTVETGFKAEDFRQELLAKFQATLELDPRYELITYAVCFRAEEDRARGRINENGYAAEEVFRLATEYWPQGFEDIKTAETFTVLLDEMVGLGVLALSRGRYALRSARIAAMLGDYDHIFGRLVGYVDREPPRRSDPLASHRPLGAGGYAPLSLRQERALIDALQSDREPLAVTFLAGSEAVADWGDLTRGLETLVELQGWPAIRRLSFRDLDGLRSVLAEAKGEARQGRPKLVVSHGRWPSPAEMDQIARLRELRDPVAPVRLVFLGGAAELLHGRTVLGHAGRLKAALIDLGPWDEEAVTHWLARHVEAFSTDNREYVQTVLRASGGFASVLDQVRLPRGRMAAADVITRVEASAARVLTPASIGLVDEATRRLAIGLVDWGDMELDDDTLRQVAESIDPEGGTPLLEGLKRMGILLPVLSAGQAQWRINSALRSVLAVAVPP